MSETLRAKLPLVAAAQAQKHVTVNEALIALDMLLALHLLDSDLSAPPADPQDGDAYLVAGGASGDWTGQDGLIAYRLDGGWRFAAPIAGMTAFLADEAALVVFDGSAWQGVGGGGGGSVPSELQNLSLIGLGTLADSTNPFSAYLNKALWAARTVADGGDGDLRYTLSKESPANVLSLLLQSGFEARAEFGLIGDDDLLFKTSPDGETWLEALRIGSADGKVSAPQGFRHSSGHALKSFLPTPGGDGVVSIWRIDPMRDPLPRTATIASISGDTITLTQARAAEFFDHARMNGVSYVRVWNTSKTAPGEPAWLKARPDADQLQVLDADDIAGWGSGETLQIGDPTSVTAGDVAAVDISPMMQAVLGQVFRQSALLVKTIAQGDEANTQAADVGLSPDGSGGSFLRQSSFPDGSLNQGQFTMPCTELSPISNSNLVFVSERGTAGAVRIMGVSVNAMFVD